MRKGIANGDDLLRAERLHAGQGDFDVGIAVHRPLDKAVEFPVMKGVPPANGFGLRYGFLRDHGFPGRPVRNRHLDIRQVIVRPDRTAAQRRRNAEGDQESALLRHHRMCPSALTASTPRLSLSLRPPGTPFPRDFTVSLYCDFTAALCLVVDSERHTVAVEQAQLNFFTVTIIAADLDNLEFESAIGFDDRDLLATR